MAKKLPEVLKNTENYQKGDIKQSMVDCFLEIDQLIISEKVSCKYCKEVNSKPVQDKKKSNKPPAHLREWKMNF